jgi:hypothetical protein
VRTPEPVIVATRPVELTGSDSAAGSIDADDSHAEPRRGSVGTTMRRSGASVTGSATIKTGLKRLAMLADVATTAAAAAWREGDEKCSESGGDVSIGGCGDSATTSTEPSGLTARAASQSTLQRQAEMFR